MPLTQKYRQTPAWLVLAVMAFNLTRAAGTIAHTNLAKATTATIRRNIISIPARIASSARTLALHLPQNWPWETAGRRLFDARSSGPLEPSQPDRPADIGATQEPQWNTPGSEARNSAKPSRRKIV